MLSELRVILFSLLLLVCGQHLQQAHAANSKEALEEASIISGRYFDILGGNRILTWRPLDITALNQYLPILFEREVNGIMDQRGLILNPGDGTYASYNFTDDEHFSTNIRNNLKSITINDLPSDTACRGDIVSLVNNKVTHNLNCVRATILPRLASLTLDDLPSEPVCTGNVSLVDNQVIKSSNCGPFAYSFIHTCTSETTIVHNNGPHVPLPGTTNTKLHYYPLPDSWLVGQTECVNPCGY